MSAREVPPCTAGEAALAEGDWSAARDAFRAALDERESGQALAGYGEALWWLGETRDGLAYRERAYAALRREGDVAGAVDVALWLCKNHEATLGNQAAARGWLARARRLVGEYGLDAWHGRVRVLEAYAADPATGEALAREAHDMALARGDVDLELCALGALGAALVAQGRVAEGVSHLDEAMAGALGGEGRHRDTVVFTSCTTILSCTSCAEFERAVQWVRATDRFTRRYGCPFLWAQCRIVYGSVLIAVGDWTKAEEELRTALRVTEDALPALRAEALATLAELRLAQGRLEEAERLVAGLDDQPAAIGVIARIHLARGRAATAETLLHRWLDDPDEAPLAQLSLAELLGEAALAQARHDETEERGRRLAEQGAAVGCELAAARGARLQGRALAATAAPADDKARAHLDAALTGFSRLGMPLEAARTRLLLADLLRTSAPEVAADEARAALTTFETLGAAGDADTAAAFLRELGEKAARRGPKGLRILTNREREVLTLLGEGLSNPEIADRLYISRRTAEQHVARVLRKLGLRSRAEAVAEAVRHLDGDYT